MDNHYDVIIIGTGAGGGTLAYHLAPSGKRILLLERGGYLPREKDNWDAKAVFVESKYRAKETWYDKDGKAFLPGIQYYVGGNTKVYGAALLRFRERDFGEVRHHGGISPAWPLSYRDFEPYYTKAEHLYHVHGEHGVDPTEGPASAPYRYPPVSHAPRIQELFDDFKRIGHHPFPLPLGILLDEVEGKALHTSACVRCAAFDGFPCLVNGKADAQVICVDPALEHSNVELLTGAYVERLETNASGREVTKVIVTRNGAEEQYSADIVVVSCGAVNSAALLLRSANEKHPGGLANSSDVVGRHYMRHNCSAFMAISKDPNPTVFQKTLALNDFYFRSDDWEYPLGEIQMLGKSDGEMLKGEAPGLGGLEARVRARLFGGALRRLLAAVGRFTPSRQPRDDQPGWTDRAEHPRDQSRRTQTPDREAQGNAWGRRVTRSIDAPFALPGQGHSNRRHRAPGWNRPVRTRYEDRGAGRELQGA
jgi:choline dehydrogenase-like flavoprotein